MLNEADRRIAPRTETAFFAVEISGRDRYQRLVRNISASGFAFEDRLATEKPGDLVLMDFPVPNSTHTLRVAGRVVHVRAEQGVGVRIENVDQSTYAKVLAAPPNMTGPLPILS